ncbi:hypothetical protein ACIRPT_24640 [Streptomyces sp. NPDC101227]|uniref:hypothetical protein n=1 Tax=Streptomyces sp. NPDC101227 TaxID=3366136 RepID=UPI003824A8A8
MTDEDRYSARTGAVPELIVWVDRIGTAISRLEEEHLPRGFPLDFSPASLQSLESFLLDVYSPADGQAHGTGLIDDAMAYLGETLLRITGGQWGWSIRPLSDVAGQPVIVPDPALHPPLAVADLIRQALAARTGSELSIAAALEATTTTFRERHLGWKPVKDHTPGVDPEPEEARHPWLTRWLTERKHHFPAWAADTGLPEATWDFSPASLDEMERLVSQRFTTEDEFEAAHDEPFLQGACWYTGEVARRNYRAAWAYRDPDEGNPWTGIPLMTQPGVRDGNIADPLSELSGALTDESGFLRECLENYQSP